MLDSPRPVGCRVVGDSPLEEKSIPEIGYVCDSERALQ